MRVDVQILAATNRDLDLLVAREQFGADLLSRISGFILWLPPLRERREDLGVLISALLKRHLADRASEVSLSVDATRDFMIGLLTFVSWRSASLHPSSYLLRIGSSLSIYPPG